MTEGAARLRWPLVATLFRCELRMTLRDRRTVLLSVLLPLLVMPLIFFASSYVESARAARLEATVYRYALGGTEEAWARQLVKDALALELDDAGEGSSQSSQGAYHFEEVASETPRDDVREQRIHLFVEGLGREEAREHGSEEADESETDEVDAPQVNLVFRADRDGSREGMRALRRRLVALRHERRQEMLPSFSEEDLYPVEAESLASRSQESGVQLGRFLVLFLVMLVMSGGSVVATDSIAGEKERGSLETLLTTACTRLEIVAAKLLLALAFALFIAVSQVVNLAVYVGFDLFDLPEGFLGAVTPAVALTLLLLLVPVACLAAGVLLLISGRAKGYKEAQLYFFPAYLLSLLPALAAVLPSLRLRSAIVLVPIANVSVAVREILAGNFDLPMLAVTFLVSCAAAGLAAWAAVKTLDSEHLVVGGAVQERALGPAALFARRVPVIYALMWVLILIVPMNIDALSSLRGQVLFNVVLVFGGGTLLMAWRYRLPRAEALSLRMPHPLAWLGVLLGAPSAFVLGVGVFHLSNQVFPAPERMLESMSQMILPEELPTWQLLVFVALLPGIFEELVFRGALLHGLRTRWGTWRGILVSAAIFGVFHVSLFRLLPTAYLGLLFGAAAVLTGSILPGMLWHALNNSLPILLTRFDLMPESFLPWHYGVASLGLVSAFGFFWAARRR